MFRTLKDLRNLQLVARLAKVDSIALANMSCRWVKVGMANKDDEPVSACLIAKGWLILVLSIYLLLTLSVAVLATTFAEKPGWKLLFAVVSVIILRILLGGTSQV